LHAQGWAASFHNVFQPWTERFCALLGQLIQLGGRHSTELTFALLNRWPGFQSRLWSYDVATFNISAHCSELVDNAKNINNSWSNPSSTDESSATKTPNKLSLLRISLLSISGP